MLLLDHAVPQPPAGYCKYLTERRDSERDDESLLHCLLIEEWGKTKSGDRADLAGHTQTPS
jgi:hypothetical protein